MENTSDDDFDKRNCSVSANTNIKAKKRSLVWDFFQRIDRNRVQCRLCKHEQNYQGTTGNILRHLKSRHALDATIKGQMDPENQLMITELMTLASSGRNSSYVDKKPIIKRKPSLDSISSDTTDHCNDSDKQKFESFATGNIFYQELQEDAIFEGDKKEQDKKSARREKLEENRILAETAYYREKAAYFRMQKHFIALQAKKIKLEIDDFVSNNKSKT